MPYLDRTYTNIVECYIKYPRQTIIVYGTQRTIEAHKFYLNSKLEFYGLRFQEQNSVDERCVQQSVPGSNV